MKAIMISIQPKYVADILNGKKTLEIRKTLPKCDLPIEVYIYCTKDTKQGFLYKVRGAGYRLESDIDLVPPLNGKVVAKFTLNRVEEIAQVFGYTVPRETDLKPFLERACLSLKELNTYLKHKHGYAWHIDNLVVFDKPKEISEFKTTQRIRYANLGFTEIKPLTRAPQSWCYCEV